MSNISLFPRAILQPRLWPDWRSSLVSVGPETVMRWHGRGFRLCWRSKSWKTPGCPQVNAEIRSLIQRMFWENPT